MSSGNPDDQYDDRRDDRNGPEGADRARAKVATPGLLLALAGAVSLVLSLLSFGLMFTKPTLFADMLIQMTEKQPPGPERQKQLDDLNAKKDEMRLDSPMSIALTGLGTVLNFLSLLGGLKMRSLSGYGISLTGAIAGIIPLSGCCCLTLPIGIWAVIVLMNPDVKAAFGSGGPPADADGY